MGGIHLGLSIRTQQRSDSTPLPSLQLIGKRNNVHTFIQSSSGSTILTRAVQPPGFGPHNQSVMTSPRQM